MWVGLPPTSWFRECLRWACWKACLGKINPEGVVTLEKAFFNHAKDVLHDEGFPDVIDLALAMARSSVFAKVVMGFTEGPGPDMIGIRIPISTCPDEHLLRPATGARVHSNRGSSIRDGHLLMPR